MPDFPERIKIDCRICGGEREFIRIAEAHVECEHLGFGSSIHSWVQITALPVAYCPDCKIVLYIGPSPEEIREKFRQRHTKGSEEVRNFFKDIIR